MQYLINPATHLHHVQYPVGCVPALLMCGVDVVVCGLHGLRCVYSLLVSSLRTLLSALLALAIGAVALMYGQAMVTLLNSNKYF